LKEVFTSNDGQVWDRDVNYEYREDGYLARTELGEMKVQGMDYAYTLHGWIKTLNSGVLNPTNDMGKDGDKATTGTAEYDFYEDDIHDLHARDVLSYTVGYYTGDYTQISAGVSGYSNMALAVAGTFVTDIDELFNGNITSYISGTTTENGVRLNPLATSYHYDQLHRFTESHVFTHATNILLNNTTADAARTNTTGPGGLGDYEMHVAYDPNGNITSLNRMAHGAYSDMDEMVYAYGTAGTNKLTNVKDYANNTGAGGFGDIVSDDVTGIGYGYHADGSLKADEEEEIDYIDWYPNGLAKRIYRAPTSTKPDLYFEYDPTGNRTLKITMTRTGTILDPETDWEYTYYAADANGITMAIYELDADAINPVLTKQETMLYGGSRLGMETSPIVVNAPLDYVNDCNNDGLASGIFQLGAFTPSNGADVDVLINNDVITDITWNTLNTIESHGEDLVEQINAQAYGFYAEMIDMGSYVYIRLKETIAGSLAGKTLMVKINGTVSPSYIKREFSIGECHENRVLGHKLFELTNYLGNVNEVISDRKIAADPNTNSITDYFEADVISYADYYPFGMDMPGRGGSMADYRYGYNGMEKDDEVSGDGNSYTTNFRQYDPRLGRWKSLDPMAGKFPNISPFVAFNNNPIYFVDPLGLESEPSKTKTVNKSGVTATKADERSVVDQVSTDEFDIVVFDYSDDNKIQTHTYTYNGDGSWTVVTVIQSKYSLGQDAKTTTYVYEPTEQINKDIAEVPSATTYVEKVEKFNEEVQPYVEGTGNILQLGEGVANNGLGNGNYVETNVPSTHNVQTPYGDKNIYKPGSNYSEVRTTTKYYDQVNNGYQYLKVSKTLNTVSGKLGILEYAPIALEASDAIILWYEKGFNAASEKLTKVTEDVVVTTVETLIIDRMITSGVPQLMAIGSIYYIVKWVAGAEGATVFEPAPFQPGLGQDRLRPENFIGW